MAKQTWIGTKTWGNPTNTGFYNAITLNIAYDSQEEVIFYNYQKQQWFRDGVLIDNPLAWQCSGMLGSNV